MEIHQDTLLRELDPADLKCVEQKIGQILSKVTAADDYGIELQIHDLILKNVSYRNTESKSEHTVEGPLLNKKAVCEGIAKTVKLLMNRKGLDCEMVTGYLKSADSFESVKNLHAWNVVRVDGTWYHLDVTADLSLSAGGTYRYDYFNLSDEEIASDHKALDQAVACPTSKQGYYYRNDQVVCTQKEFVRRLTWKLLLRQKEVVIKLPSTADPQAVCQKVLDNTEKAMKRAIWPYKTVDITYNLDQLVFQIRVA